MNVTTSAPGARSALSDAAAAPAAATTVPAPVASRGSRRGARGGGDGQVVAPVGLRKGVKA